MLLVSTNAFSMTNNADRRSFINKITSVTAAGVAGGLIQGSPEAAFAAPEILRTENGIRYAITKSADGQFPQQGDFVVIEYTGYLTSGQVRWNEDDLLVTVLQCDKVVLIYFDAF